MSVKLLVLLVVGCFALASAQGPCLSSNRTDCGFVGINQDQCQQKNCCWQPASSSENVPWCFYRSAPSPSCTTSPVCSGHGTCQDGACKCSSPYLTCSSGGTTDCAVNSQTDVNNCGSCGNVCYRGEGVLSSICSGGCNVTCDASRGYILCYNRCVKASSCSGVAPFSADDVNTMLGYFSANIDFSGNGATIASPSTERPNYYFNWARDAAISLNVLLQMNQQVATAGKFDQSFKDYVKWVRMVQFAKDPNGIDVRGEPKYYVDGRVYDGGWMRPQNDGPALRSVTLINYAFFLISKGEGAFVSQYLWNSDASQPSIKHDLDYVVSSWQSDSGDPWEEIKAQVFFVKITQRKALLMGVKIATYFNDSAAASVYAANAESLKAAIDAHWNNDKAYVMEIPVQREIDSAVHLGALYGDAGDGFYTPTSARIQSTVTQLWNYFAGGIFAINTLDSQAGLPGLLVGRYPNDHYDGYDTTGFGNPWILCSLALGEIFYRNAQYYAETGVIAVDEVNHGFFQLVAAAHAPVSSARHELLRSTLRPGTTLSVNRAEDRAAFLATVEALLTRGDGQLVRVKYHTAGAGLHFGEQLNKDTGYEQGANDLTWSYGTGLAAMLARASAVTAFEALL